MENGFHGAKAAVFIGARPLIYQRDRGVVWPGYWDFPGGGREGDETPHACLRREVLEDFALDVPICSDRGDHVGQGDIVNVEPHSRGVVFHRSFTR